MIQSLKKIAAVLFLVSSLAVQSGCIVGMGMGSGLLTIFGASMFYVGQVGMGHYEYSQPGRSDWLFLSQAGILLDEQNPGRVDALNIFPLEASVAEEMKVSVLDLETYNDELNEVIAANSEIESVIMKFFKNEGFISQEDITSIVDRLKVESFNDLIEVVQADVLTNESLSLFANAFKLSPKTAEVYLKTRWQVSIAQ